MQLQTPREVIKKLGGIKAVAELTGRKYSAAGNWNRGKRFPANTYRVLYMALLDRGFRAPASMWGQK